MMFSINLQADRCVVNKLKHLNILIYNWRDIKNPKRGGSETFIHEICERLVKWGHNITIFTSKYENAKEYEIINGVKIIRAGSSLTLRIYALIYYILYFKNQYDIVIEVKNGGLPWFLKILIDDPYCVLAHQTGRNFKEFNFKNSTWYYELVSPFSLIMYLLEPVLLRSYKGSPLIVVSKSTAQSFFELGFDQKKLFYVPEGVNQKNLVYEGKKASFNEIHFIYLGRIKPSKRVDHIIKAFYYVKTKHPAIKLNIVGNVDYDYKKRLDDLINIYSLNKNIVFFGYVSEKEKKELLSKSYAMVITSIREGWGLVVTEANLLGIPVIGYDVPGLRDSILNGKTGLLCENGDIISLAKKILYLIENKEMRNKLGENARIFSNNFNWDKSATIFLKHLSNIIGDVK